MIWTKNFVEKCKAYNAFTDKKTKEPLRLHKMSEKCWEKVAVDLLRSMPSSKHIVVEQDLASRFPHAKFVSSTSGDRVIPTMANIYDTCGNLDVQLSNNGPLFNSKKVHEFAIE